ncbi:hypothetical protein SAMN05877809_103337 [Rhodobacter sp. JA431]|uniref:hypothetical protein n=1 Tax=Rhodobacter sp. JA431 TaxID=570013 RepID=UPI000BDD2C8C|nr:hypothetical protein [Rhodobacter sp. JA431]SOC04905.1 hypothetical protein SAMN05877809_103337 [Rhodobacter sp. JA431]
MQFGVGITAGIGGAALAAALACPALAGADLREGEYFFANGQSYVVAAQQEEDQVEVVERSSNGLFAGPVTVFVTRGNGGFFTEADRAEALAVAKLYCARYGLGISDTPEEIVMKRATAHDNPAFGMVGLCTWEGGN